MKHLIGNKNFYKMVLVIALPIMIQNGITQFVSLLDNIMVGQVGTEQMSGVAIVNQLIFVFNLCIFGAVSGPGIFSAQFYGQGNHEGVRYTFRFKLMICSLIAIAGIFIFSLWGKTLISFYLHEDSSTGKILNTLGYAEEYLAIMLLGLIPFTISQVYSSTLRETGETIVPMNAGIAAVVVNLFFNTLLIFGNLGCPRLGIVGAAIATTIARVVECLIVVTWTHSQSKRNVFIQGVYRQFNVPLDLIKRMTIKGFPLLLNETLWSAGTAALMQCYSIRGLPVIAGLNISTIIANLFNVVFIALGSAIAIIVGPLLGAGKMEEAKDTANKMIFFSVVTCLFIGLIMVVVAPLFPNIYKTTDEVKHLATTFIRIAALCMPMYAFLHATYFTIRSGGKTFITFLFDSVYLWVISVPVAYFLAHYTGINIVPLYLICQLIDIIKCLIGYILLKKEIWLQNIVE